MSDTTFEPAALPPVVFYKLTQADYNEMCEAAGGVVNRLTYRYAFWPAILFNLAAGAWAIGPVLAGKRDFRWIYVVNFALAFVLLAWRHGFRPWMRRWSLRNLKLEGRDYKIAFQDADVVLSAGGLTSSIQHSEIASYTETGDYFFFWINRFQAVIVPKRAIDQEGQASLRAYAIASNWKKR